MEIQVTFFMGRRWTAQSSVDAIVLDAMGERCRDLGPWLFSIVRRSHYPELVKLKVGDSWLDFCRGRSSRKELDDARRMLLSVFRIGSFQEPPVGGAIAFLSSLEIPIAGLVLPDRNAADLKAMAIRMWDEVIAAHPVRVLVHQRLRFSPFSVEIARVIGRAIGVLALAGVDLSLLPLPRELLSFLHPRNRRSFPSLNAYLMVYGGALTSLICNHEEFDELVASVSEVLGASGTAIITDEEWFSSAEH